MVDSLSLRRLTGKIWLAAAARIAGIISHGSHHRKTLLAVLRDVVVGARDVDVLRLMGRRCENESLVVIAIARRIAIRRRQGLEVRHRGRVGPRVDRIDLLQLLNTKGDVSRRRSVRFTALALHGEAGPAGTLRGSAQRY